MPCLVFLFFSSQPPLFFFMSEVVEWMIRPWINSASAALYYTFTTYRVSSTRENLCPSLPFFFFGPDEKTSWILMYHRPRHKCSQELGTPWFIIIRRARYNYERGQDHSCVNYSNKIILCFFWRGTRWDAPTDHWTSPSDILIWIY